MVNQGFKYIYIVRRMSRVLPDGHSLAVESDGPAGRPSFSLGGQEDEYRPDLDDVSFLRKKLKTFIKSF